MRRIQARKLVNTMPKKMLKIGDKEIEGEEICPICIENYKFNDILRMLPCKYDTLLLSLKSTDMLRNNNFQMRSSFHRHAFHRKCVDPWLRVRETCPMCKFDVLKSLGLGVRMLIPSYVIFFELHYEFGQYHGFSIQY